APCQDGLAVRAEGHARDSAMMAEGFGRGPACGGVPEPRRPVGAAGEEGLAIGAERHAPDPGPMSEWPSESPAGGRVPEPRSAVPSRLPVSRVLPSGLNATPQTWS